MQLKEQYCRYFMHIERAIKKATVSQALMEYIQRRRQLDVLELFGTVEYDDKYDYKKQRIVE